MEFDDGLNICGKSARQISGDPAAGDVGHGRNPASRENVFQKGPVRAVRLQKLRAYFVSNICHVCIRTELGDSEHKFASQRISVGMESAGGQRQ